MLEVKIEKILPVTEARDSLNKLVDEVEGTDDLYVLTKNGKPVAVLVGVHHLEKLTGTSHEELMEKAEEVEEAQEPAKPEEESLESAPIGQDVKVDNSSDMPDSTVDIQTEAATPEPELSATAEAKEEGMTGVSSPDPIPVTPSAVIPEPVSGATSEPFSSATPTPDPSADSATPAAVEDPLDFLDDAPSEPAATQPATPPPIDNTAAATPAPIPETPSPAPQSTDPMNPAPPPATPPQF